MIYLRKNYSLLPQKAGVYVYLDKKDRVLYVGKANNLKARISSYFAKNAVLGEKTRILVSQVEKIKITIVESELEALLLEAFYIKKYRPKYNIRLSDDKSYVMIRITLKSDYPAVLLSRIAEDEKSTYFGPYPNARAVRTVLRTIRRVFPYQSVLNHPKNPCLYNHLGLCPCLPAFESPPNRREYKKNIRGIIRILNAQSQKVLQEIEKKRDKLSNQENYEGAKELQNKINALKIITEPFHRPFEYHVNPNLRADLRKQELDELKNSLGLKHQNLGRIECFDISNTQGAYATGSMVVFVEGEKDSSEYRRFRIKKDGKPNDFAMMKEVLIRRFKRIGWDRPDLIIVDGGKGQVSAALDAISTNNIQIPLIGLAKREETIIVPRVSKVSGVSKVSKANEILFTEVSLPKHSKALHFIRRVRDEAHRFAITYHRLLRSKASLG